MNLPLAEMRGHRLTYEIPNGNQEQVPRTEGTPSPCSGSDVGKLLEDTYARRTAIRG